ncbi:VOC family protein [Polaribacter dokdonensis]|mgnify:FL=1|jgi:lactoylglutathione lyase|uniref:Catechol 2,3-dioxygenase n=1 Tax=Polaribacter dokdonensis DSW-5 TaxID=1300348 RepID=A0A0M9CF20_9FLAO|nr:VOC family protein [Polaribacter dokdonensis]KOY51331.1 Glyoxalase/bleomycin resistance protein/dioxygenase superfamily protein [Polaribacter dokdonensis DSW-5]SEE13780.1 Catechol 2,3-dioxygenase [Polaribacter dokdonensis DSW-5]
MRSFSFDHIAISVLDVNESISFYQDVFGFKEIENTASTSKTRWLLIDDKIQLHLIPRPKLKVVTNKAVHFAISTENLVSFSEHLESLNIQFSDWIGSVKKDYVRNDGVLQIYFQDPNGYWIEVNNAV